MSEESTEIRYSEGTAIIVPGFVVEGQTLKGIVRGFVNDFDSDTVKYIVEWTNRPKEIAFSCFVLNSYWNRYIEIDKSTFLEERAQLDQDIADAALRKKKISDIGEEDFKWR